MIHPFEIEELACEILGLDYDEIDANTAIIEEHLIEEFNIDFDMFCELINRLVPLIEVGKSPLTDEIFKGFAKDGMWLSKIKINNKP